MLAHPRIDLESNEQRGVGNGDGKEHEMRRRAMVHHEDRRERADAVDQPGIGQQPHNDQQPRTSAIHRVGEQLRPRSTLRADHLIQQPD